MAKNIGLAVSNRNIYIENGKAIIKIERYFKQSIAMIESNLLPSERRCSEFSCFGPPTELRPVSMWYRNSERETMFREQPDPHFRYDLVCAFIMFLSLGLLQLIAIQG